MSSHNFGPTMRSCRDSDTPDTEPLFESDSRRESEYSGLEDYENSLEQTDSDGDPFEFSAHLRIDGTTGGTTADHNRMQFHTVAQGAGNGSRPDSTATFLKPQSKVKVRKHDAKKIDSSISQSAYSTPDPKDRRRRQRTRAADPATASRRESQRRWRWRKYSYLVDQFAKDTKSIRMWYQHQQAQKGVWDLERTRLDRRIPELESELAKARSSPCPMQQDRVNMNAAQKKLEDDHGEEIENGRICQEKLMMWTGCLKMENDCYPDELEARDEDDMKEELEAFQDDAAKEGNEDLWEDIEDGEDEAEVMEDQIMED
ncbi:hypothetical protein AC579_1545 [Pseudocercospora musae]|uniref:Uncharacterized protein n=1 Tax=Pseudocercospora musae TaxID=113226 RepID=A0A139IMH4_9PEZI|nr:hypothetical protein AC579_1545 [Pseudocercospora musae]